MSTDADKKALDTAIELSKQLIALATGVVTAVVAIFGLFARVPSVAISRLFSFVFLELLSVLFGLLFLGAITAHLYDKKRFDVAYEKTPRFMLMIQWVLFLLGMAVFAWISLTLN